jgi:hypothetical protein
LVLCAGQDALACPGDPETVCLSRFRLGIASGTLPRSGTPDDGDPIHPSLQEMEF